MKIEWGGGSVSAEWDRPQARPRALLVLAHGAGGDLNDQVLRGVGARLSCAGVAVLRFNFPYREAGRRAPGAQSTSQDCYRAVVDAVREPGIPVVIGGKSYGGRIASHIVADGTAADGLAFLSYPLHPPGRFDKLRDEHLARLRVPMLFVQGTRDSFARPDLLDATLSGLNRAMHVPLDGGDHSLNVRGRTRDDVLSEIASAIDAFFASVTAARSR